MSPFIKTFLVFTLTSAAIKLQAQIKKETSDQIWQKIAPHFTPPATYEDEYGSYASPLIFDDGSTVKTAQDWQKRRGEILNRWHQWMGEWPELLTEQTLEVLDTTYRESFTQYRVRFKWLPEEQTEGYLLIPPGAEKKPAVITVYYEPETAIGQGKPDRDFALLLARRGFVTLSLGTTQATAAKTYSLYYPNLDNAQVEPPSMLAYAAANAWHVLAKVPGVDADRIGIMGHSFGGKWAMFASCLFEKFACGVWSDPGIVFDETKPDVNYWEPWYLGYHTPPWRERGMPTKENPAKGLYAKLTEQGYDLHELHALMAPRPFLVSGGSEDPPKRWIPLNHSIGVNALLGYKNRAAMINRAEHSPTPSSNQQAYQFLEYFLKHKGINRD